MVQKMTTKEHHHNPSDPPTIVWNITPELLTTRESAKLLGIGERTLWRHSRSGAVPAPKKFGGVVRYSKSELLQWVEQGCPRGDGRAGK
jgi:excisionase family DNA binding protein